MKITRGMVTAAFAAIIIGAAIIGIMTHQSDRNREELAGRIFSREGTSPALTVEELKSYIRKYEKRIERHVADAAKTATYWKILANRLMERELYGEALEALEQAIYCNPDDAALHCYTGISAGRVAKSIHLFPGRDNQERMDYYALAESAYKRAIELDGRYLRPLYGLGVLYVFELERPEDAIPYLKTYLEISRNDVDVMFVLARAHFMLREFQAALDLYDRIITVTGDEQKRLDAHNNRQQVMGHIYG